MANPISIQSLRLLRMDGKTFADDTMVVALGIRMSGEKTLTLHRLGLCPPPGRSFKTTNCLESVNSLVEEPFSKVDSWKNSSQKPRWLATALLEIEPRSAAVHGPQASGEAADGNPTRVEDRSDRAERGDGGVINTWSRGDFQLGMGLTRPPGRSSSTAQARLPSSGQDVGGSNSTNPGAGVGGPNLPRQRWKMDRARFSRRQKSLGPRLLCWKRCSRVRHWSALRRRGTAGRAVAVAMEEPPRCLRVAGHAGVGVWTITTRKEGREKTVEVDRLQHDRTQRESHEDATVGIALCSRKNDAVVRMTLPEGEKRIVAARYEVLLPSAKELEAAVQEGRRAPGP